MRIAVIALLAVVGSFGGSAWADEDDPVFEDDGGDPESDDSDGDAPDEDEDEDADAEPEEEEERAMRRAEARRRAAAEAERHKRFYFRAGLIAVLPAESSDEVVLENVDGEASLALDNGPIDGSGSAVNSAFVLGGSLGMVLPWLDGRLAAELVIGLPFTVEFKATGTLRDESLAPTALGIPTGVPPLGEELGEAKAIPIVLTSVYRWRMNEKLRPYAGGGLSMLFTTGAKITNPILTEIEDPDLSVSPAPGLVLQGGVESKVWNSVYLALDIKFIALLVARAKVTNMVVRTPSLPLFESVTVGDAKLDVTLNPFIVQLAAGFNF